MEDKQKFKEVTVLNDEIKGRLQKIKNNQELPDIIVDQAVGSRSNDDDDEGITRMWCPNCGFQVTWAGDYLHKVYECPDCEGYFYGWLYEGPGGKRV